MRTLIQRQVALTSTLTIFETLTPGRPLPPGLDVLLPALKDQFEQNYRRTSDSRDSVYRTLFPKAMALERAFVKAGGLLVVGTDPTGGGGVVPGFANQRAVELLVEAGFTPVEAIAVAHPKWRALSRDGGLDRHHLHRASRPISWSSTATPRAPSATCAKSTRCSVRASATIRAQLIASVTGKVGLW